MNQESYELDEDVQEIMNKRSIKQKLKKRAVLQNSFNSYKYEKLKVEEKPVRQGQIRFEFDLNEYGSFELLYSTAREESKQFKFLEALTEGFEFDIYKEIYGMSKRNEHFEEKGLQDVLEENKLPREYRDPLNDFLHDIFWEE